MARISSVKFQVTIDSFEKCSIVRDYQEAARGSIKSTITRFIFSNISLTSQHCTNEELDA